MFNGGAANSAELIGVVYCIFKVSSNFFPFAILIMRKPIS